MRPDSITIRYLTHQTSRQKTRFALHRPQSALICSQGFGLGSRPFRQVLSKLLHAPKPSTKRSSTLLARGRRPLTICSSLACLFRSQHRSRSVRARRLPLHLELSPLAGPQRHRASRIARVVAPSWYAGRPVRGFAPEVNSGAAAVILHVPALETRSCRRGCTEQPGRHGLSVVMVMRLPLSSANGPG
jgi:hypothetical protein